MKWIIIILLLLSCMAIGGCSNVESKIAATQIVDTTAGSTTSIRLYETLEELTNSSDIVAEIVPGDSKQLIEYKNAKFTLIDTKIKDIFVGNSSLNNSTIKVLELGDYQVGDTQLVQSGERYLIFLRKYVGSVTSEEAYVPVGVYQGKLKIIDDQTLVFEGGGDIDENQKRNVFQQELASSGLIEAVEKIKASKSNIKE